MNSHSDEKLQQIIKAEQNQRASGRCLTADDYQESEEREEAAKKIITDRHQIGMVGREGLPKG